jgi:hypothetical protein
LCHFYRFCHCYCDTAAEESFKDDDNIEDTIACASEEVATTATAIVDLEADDTGQDGSRRVSFAQPVDDASVSDDESSIYTLE